MNTLSCFFYLALVSSAVIAVSFNYPEPAGETMDDLFEEADMELSVAPPGCSANYPLMSSTLPKVLHSQVPFPGGVCVDTNGNFVAVLWQTTIKYTYFFDKNGWVVKTIALPADSLEMASCVFTEYKLFLTDTIGQKFCSIVKVVLTRRSSQLDSNSCA